MINLRLKIFIICFCFAPFLSTLVKANTPGQEGSINVKSLGAKGDGKTDDYNAFIAVANYINLHKGGTVFIPAGTYYIAEYHTDKSNVKDILFKNCTNLTIKGDHAVISVNGNFFRNADHKGSKFWYSNTNAIIPLAFENCAHLTIQSLEINGNVNQTTRNNDVAEGEGHLISLLNCQDVKISDVFVHHAEVDGIYIGGALSSNFNFNNIKSYNNARQGMSITWLRNGLFKNCRFANTGKSEGTYGFHAPAAGVDIECRKATPAQRTSNLVFEQCFFTDNFGDQFACSAPQDCSGVILKDCKISAQGSTSARTMLLAADSVNLINCEIDCGVGSVYAGFNGVAGANVTIQHCIIKSSSSGVVSTPDAKGVDIVKITDNTFYYTGSARIKSYFIFIKNPNAVFLNNNVHIPSGTLKMVGPSAMVGNALKAQGNSFITDGGKKVSVSYEGTKDIQDKN
ncbi:right-handed parallel beta-helix repeat-containing protein [Mucilaginibacter sp. dw_454]|uniref:right-handed parallel beta-helix repeat-containing protein n=1 Tax=Mucilaginibacter sp. dw_454 TaxID=2720079 RepID=UPI001BD2731D|nr:right-handed parallel beta-helix repeat-containing protein [Mucilaginibacter sp. dw_454]